MTPLESAWADFLAGRSARRDAAVAGGNATAAQAERDQHLCQIITVMVRCGFPPAAFTAEPLLIKKLNGRDDPFSLNDLFAARDLAQQIATSTPDIPALADIAASMARAIDALREDCWRHSEAKAGRNAAANASPPPGWMIPL
jgi:hypothetical protein